MPDVKLTWQAARGVWGIPHVDGRCPFLEDALCTIYKHRPGFCRQFPTEPFRGCLVWPKEECGVKEQQPNGNGR